MNWFKAILPMLLSTQELPPRSCHHTTGRRKSLIPQGSIFRNSVSTSSRKGWRKLWLALLKYSQKIWRWFGALVFYILYHLQLFQMRWLYSFVNNVYYITVLILLLLLSNHVSLILKLNQKKKYLPWQRVAFYR